MSKPTAAEVVFILINLPALIAAGILLGTAVSVARLAQAIGPRA